MRGWIEAAMQELALRHRQWRRARNLRLGGKAAARSMAPKVAWAVAAAALGTIGGALLIVGHARQLGHQTAAAGDALGGAGLPASVAALQAAAPGASFEVPARSSVTVTRQHGAAIVVAAGMQPAPPVRVDLCTQELGGGRLLPIRIGYRFDDVARLVERAGAGKTQLTLRNVALVDADSSDIPQMQITGVARANFAAPDALPLQVSWRQSGAQAQWIGDAGTHGLRRDGWLLWTDAALRVHRRHSARCRSGELVLQLYRKGGDERALVTAFPAHGPALSAWLRPGQYTVPTLPPASLEDQALFRGLLAHGLVRLNEAGLIDVAPRDLAAWQSAAPEQRATALSGWGNLARDEAGAKLFKRLHRMADGAYVREQVRIFNNERRLLAWRVRPAHVRASWLASAGAAPLATSTELPPGASRLFAELPQGWAAWQRVAAWPGEGEGRTRIGMLLPQPARGGERIEILLIGQVLGVEGARLLGAPRAACTGRACPSKDAAQLAVFEALPGARNITLSAAPLSMPALAGAGDQQYRHLQVARGRLQWRALASNSSTARAAPLATVRLADRYGTALWEAGAPTPAAVRAGLSTLLGLRVEHANSVAGMLARIPSPSGQPHSARLALDLSLQQIAHDALQCIGMRRGRWDGARCAGGQAPPQGRQAGLVVIDTGTGDILAAAGAGLARVDAANWNEVRDFDRANPDRSPLRLPALQHGGGAHSSPGSTFKIVSALGLELAAQTDPQVSALLAGMPLQAINRMAERKGFAFQTGAASYPHGTRLAHITNYKDQHLDRRARDGRLGLSQALTYSLNTWFAWSGELSDRSLFGRAEGGAPDLQALEPRALDSVRPIAAMAHRLGFGQDVRLDGGLLPAAFNWSPWDALQASQARIDPIHTRHELRQMSIGLRMQATPLHMAMVAGAVGEGRTIAPRLLLELDGREAEEGARTALGVRVDRIREGMKGVVEEGTAAAAFRASGMERIRRGLAGKTGTAPAMATGADGVRRELATVWFTGWLEPGSLPGQENRLALAAFVSHSEASGGEHAAPIVAAVLAAMAAPKREQKGK